MRQFQYAGADEFARFVRDEDYQWAERTQRRVMQLRQRELDELSALPWQAKLVRLVRGVVAKFRATPELVHYEQVLEAPYSVGELKQNLCFDTLKLLKACERDGVPCGDRQDYLQQLREEFIGNCGRWRFEQQRREHSGPTLVSEGVRHAV